MADERWNRFNKPNWEYGQLRRILTGNFLIQEYIENKLSLNQIAGKIGCSKKYVLLMMKEHEVPRRESGCAKHLRDGNTLDITDDLRDYVDGLLVSDGHILEKNKWSARYDQTLSVRYSEWADVIKKDLLVFGVESNLLPYTTDETVIASTGQVIPPSNMIMLYTRHYDSFLSFRRRWYPRGRKIIPPDIRLTPQFCANWYMGDGYYDPSTGRAALSTHSFSLNDVKSLIKRIKQTIGVVGKIYPVRSQKNQPIIKISRKDSKVFLNYIKDLVVSCFEYKLEV